MIKDINDTKIHVNRNVKTMLNYTDSAASKKYFGPDNYKILPHTINQISREYALNTMLKADIMRYRPQMPVNYPIRSSLSPHYLRGYERNKAATETGDSITTKAALVNARIELSYLVNKDKSKRLRIVRKKRSKRQKSSSKSKRSISAERLHMVAEKPLKKIPTPDQNNKENTYTTINLDIMHNSVLPTG